jgi:signal transduction histidine kinase
VILVTILSAVAAVFSITATTLLILLLSRDKETNSPARKTVSTIPSVQERAERRDIDIAGLNEDIVILSRILVHDLNNKLGAIIGTVSVIDYQLNNNIPVSSDNLRDDLQTIKGAIDEANRFIGSFQRFYKRGIVMGVPVDMKRIVRESVEWCRSNDEAGRGLELTMADDEAQVTGNPGYVANLVRKVCMNGLEASGPEDTVRVSFDVVPTNRDFEFKYNYRETDRLCRIIVSDDGRGISEAEKELLFKPFESTSGDKSGVGLVIVKEVLKWHNGFIEIESNPGAGTTVTMYMPERSSRG